MKNKTWFVWNPIASIPRFQHSTFESAKQEAKRLAVLNPGTEFMVLESIGAVVKTDVIWKDHEEDIEIPF